MKVINSQILLLILLLVIGILPAITAAGSSDDTMTTASTPAQGFDLIRWITGIFGGQQSSATGNSNNGQGVNTDAVILVQKAWALNAKEKFQDANSVLDQAASLDPDTPGISFNRGWALAGLGRYEEALVALDKATAETPDSEIAWANKGFVLSHLGRCSEAVSAYTQAQALDPTDRAVRQDLGLISSHCTVSVKTSTQTATPRPSQSATTSSVPPTTVSSTQSPQKVMENMNTGTVYNGATSEPTFTFPTSVVIVSLTDYHWNNAKGATPGTISIQNVNTNGIYGPFSAYGVPGQGGVPNANWQTEPGITIPSGTYRVKDSDPATWSQNSQSGGAGMVHIVYQQTTSSAFSPASVSTTQTRASTTTTTQPVITQAASPSSSDLGSVWVVKEYGDMGNWDGKWVRQKGTNTFDASWSNGAITDTVTITSLSGNKITLHRAGNNGDYTGTISSDGKSITGKGSWYDAGESWTVVIV